MKGVYLVIDVVKSHSLLDLVKFFHLDSLVDVFGAAELRSILDDWVEHFFEFLNSSVDPVFSGDPLSFQKGNDVVAFVDSTSCGCGNKNDAGELHF